MTRKVPGAVSSVKAQQSSPSPDHRFFCVVGSVRMASSEANQPRQPLAKKANKVMEMFGDVRIDNYYWLRDDSRSDSEVLFYLQQENDYTDSIMSGKPFFFNSP